MISNQNSKFRSHLTSDTSTAIVGSSDRRLKMPKTFLIVVLVVSLTPSCKKFIEIDPPRSELVTETVFENDATAIAAVSGIYRLMIDPSGFASGSPNGLSLLAGLSADELISSTEGTSTFYNNSLTSTNTTIKSALWGSGYKYIYACNSILEGLSHSNSLSNQTKLQLEGEARFLRAFTYFYLTNLFGDIPLITSSNYETNMQIGKSSPTQIFSSIKDDLKLSKDLLTDDYSLFNSKRVRATKWAAMALLARVYIYENEWQKAEIEASEIITHHELFSLETDLTKIFLKDSREAIWQLMPVQPGNNTWDAITFYQPSGIPSTYLSENLLESIGENDKRRNAWIKEYTYQTKTYYFPFKYKLQYNEPLNEYSMVIRISEIYLIRAEARAQLNLISQSINDIDSIRSRADISLISETMPSVTKDDLLTLIQNERRIELFSEWGHRWFDLKRAGQATALLNEIKNNNFQKEDLIYPIPQSEILNNKKLNPQNPGY